MGRTVAPPGGDEQPLPGGTEAGPAGVIDGRSTRWEEHRERRRAELVAATLRAIRRHGAGVGMDGIAATAGTSKTVFYRHFEDRAGLYRAVVAQVDTWVVEQVAIAEVASERGDDEDGTGSAERARELVRRSVDSYLRLVEEEPEVYRFVVAAPLVPARERDGTDPAATATGAISSRMAELIALYLQAAGRPEAQALRWAHAVVSLVRTAGDEWLRSGATASGTSRAEVVHDVTELLWGGLRTVWE